MAKKEQGEWKNHTLAEVALTDKIFWRAQTTEAPDGKQFTGVRKYIKKANGDEVATKAGITFEVNEDLGKNVLVVIELLQKAMTIMMHADRKAKKKHPKAENAKIVSKEPKVFFVLQFEFDGDPDDVRFLMSYEDRLVKTTRKLERAMRFDKKLQALAFREGLGKGQKRFSVVPYTDEE